VRALYCYARLVDELGDAYEGDRLDALDELELQVGLTFDGEPSWPVLRNAADRASSTCRGAVPPPDRGESDRPARREYETWADLSTTACTPPTRAGGSCSACCGG
jgi:hypothetical protein